MRVMFNSPVLYVVSYPACDGIEVIDKRSGRGVFMREEAAERFTRELNDAIEADEDAEAIGDLMENFDGLLIQPAIYH